VNVAQFDEPDHTLVYPLTFSPEAACPPFASEDREHASMAFETNVAESGTQFNYWSSITHNYSYTQHVLKYHKLSY
jgi:hypothetical protein